MPAAHLDNEIAVEEASDDLGDGRLAETRQTADIDPREWFVTANNLKHECAVDLRDKIRSTGEHPWHTRQIRKLSYLIILSNTPDFPPVPALSCLIFFNVY